MDHDRSVVCWINVLKNTVVSTVPFFAKEIAWNPMPPRVKMSSTGSSACALQLVRCAPLYPSRVVLRALLFAGAQSVYWEPLRELLSTSFFSWTCGCVHKWWYTPKMDGLEWKIPLKWMILGYPYDSGNLHVFNIREEVFSAFIQNQWTETVHVRRNVSAAA